MVARTTSQLVVQCRSPYYPDDLAYLTYEYDRQPGTPKRFLLVNDPHAARKFTLAGDAMLVVDEAREAGVIVGPVELVEIKESS
ncbi:MAG: hypothetical protein AB7G11_16110 [Phycisphaerales bacterium]